MKEGGQLRPIGPSGLQYSGGDSVCHVVAPALLFVQCRSKKNKSQNLSAWFEESQPTDDSTHGVNSPTCDTVLQTKFSIDFI